MKEQTAMKFSSPLQHVESQLKGEESQRAQMRIPMSKRMTSKRVRDATSTLLDKVLNLHRS